MEKQDWSHVPKTLEEAMIVLDNELPEETKQEFRDYTPSNTKLSLNGTELPEHFNCYIIASMGMRNYWGLWQDSPLAYYFRERGIWMADDMSGVISTAYYHHLKGDVVTDDAWLEKERQFYDAYWKSSDVNIPTFEEWKDSLNHE